MKAVGNMFARMIGSPLTPARSLPNNPPSKTKYIMRFNGSSPAELKLPLRHRRIGGLRLTSLSLTTGLNTAPPCTTTLASERKGTEGTPDSSRLVTKRANRPNPAPTFLIRGFSGVMCVKTLGSLAGPPKLLLLLSAEVRTHLLLQPLLLPHRTLPRLAIGRPLQRYHHPPRPRLPPLVDCLSFLFLSSSILFLSLPTAWSCGPPTVGRAPAGIDSGMIGGLMVRPTQAL